ncbi:RDD family protein [Roseateles sp.]|uniref:RDD family protein n=1 Tax=Roseateles sp. TaxID=1971397 RepID=UPI003BA7A757
MSAPLHPSSDQPLEPQLAFPGLARRMASFIYEGVLLFGIVFIAGYLFSALTQQRHALQGQHALQGFLFIVLAIYFCWFWTHGGQTVAMKAWHIRVVDVHGRALTQGRALARYVLSWLWFLPALLIAWVMDVRGGGAIFGCLFFGVLVYATVARFHPQRQFLHDALCATRLITQLPPKR